MTNAVTVTEAFGSGAEGHWLFVATGSLMDDTNIAIVTPVVSGALLPGSNGTLSVSLLASDNFGSGELLWNAFIQIQGYSKIDCRDFQVNFGLGANQNLFTILKASGWTPIST
jgi:hypothetical protein